MSAWLLADGTHHHHHDEHAHGHADHNLRAAYLHVLADAMTSIFAIVALLIGRMSSGMSWLDPLAGLVGAVMIARWSWGLMHDTGAVLLDTAGDKALADDVRASLETDGDRISDLHVWRVGPGRYAAIIALVSCVPRNPEHYKGRLVHRPELAHVTIEPHRCREHPLP